MLDRFVEMTETKRIISTLASSAVLSLVPAVSSSLSSVLLQPCHHARRQRLPLPIIHTDTKDRVSTENILIDSYTKTTEVDTDVRRIGIGLYLLQDTVL